MAYLGSTAASSVANPPRCYQPMDIARTVSTQLGGRVWAYACTESNSTAAFVANFFTDAKLIGMREGDIVIYAHRNSTAATSSIVGMGVLGAVTTDGACLTTFSFMTST